MLVSKRVARLKKRAEAAIEAHSIIATKAAAYVRVSTEEQAQHGHGLESQKSAIKDFARSQGYDLVRIFVDAGVSGATKPEERNGFRQLTEQAETRSFSVLLVYKFDRLARQIVYAVTTVKDLDERFGVVLRSVTEPIDTATPMGRTLFAILAGMAENEREVITERTWSGRREKAKTGGFAGGPAPFGYERDRKGGLVVNEREALIILRIFDARTGGKTQSQIAGELNAAGIKTRRGAPWRQGQIGYLLDNPKYRGNVEYLFRRGGADVHVFKRGKHKAIVKG